MSRIIRAEWLKLTTTKLPWVLMAVAIVYSVSQAVVLVLIAAPGLMEGFAGATATDGLLQRPEYITTVLGQTGTASTFALLIGIVAMTGEFRHMTITSTFLATPRRSRVLAAKMIVYAILGAALAVVTFGAVLVATLVALIPFDHAPVTSSTAVSVLVGAVLGLALFAVLGVALGSVITNQVAAIVVALVWTLLLEALITLAFPSVGRWLPGGALDAAMDVGLQADVTGGMAASDPLPAGVAIVVLVGYAAVLALIASRTTLRRDIT